MIEIAVTVDDPHLGEGALLTAEARDDQIRAALKCCNNLKVVLFVCGHRLDSTSGSELLKAWGNENHLLGNHTFSHLNLNSEGLGFVDYVTDINRCHKMISDKAGFSSFFRYPYLKGGNTKKKRNEVREFLKESGYRQGYVSVDASDWCIDARLQSALKRDEEADLTPYRDFYLAHVKERVLYYDLLVKDVVGRSIKHTLLIHHNLLNALFLGDLLEHLKGMGCKLINAREAYQDPVYLSEPNIIPFGESIVWALAKEKGNYEREAMDPLRL